MGANEATTPNLQHQLEQHALAYLAIHQYSKNVKLLQLHQQLKFDQMPPDCFDPGDPAAEVIGFVISYCEQQLGNDRGQYYIPSNTEVSLFRVGLLYHKYSGLVTSGHIQL